jgi:hypothetical protein
MAKEVEVAKKKCASDFQKVEKLVTSKMAEVKDEVIGELATIKRVCPTPLMYL